MTDPYQFADSELTRCEEALKSINPAEAPEQYSAVLDLYCRWGHVCAEIKRAEDYNKTLYSAQTEKLNGVDIVEDETPITEDPDYHPVTEAPVEETVAEQDAPTQTVSTVEIRTALADAKSRGVDAHALLVELGYGTLNNVPASDYGKVLKAIKEAG